MRVPKVRLYIQARLASGQYKYVDPAWNENRTLREGYALIDGKQEPHPEGLYYLRSLCGKKRVWQAVGSKADAAIVALRNKEHDFHAVSLGRAAPEPAPETTPKVTVADGAAKYLAEIRRSRSAKTIAACERILGLFEQAYAGRALAGLRREDLLDHFSALRKRGLASRTVYNHAMRIKGFLRSQGVCGLLKPEDIPDYDEPEVEAYDADQVDSLFRAADAEERLLYQFFLATGFRDQEVATKTHRHPSFYAYFSLQLVTISNEVSGHSPVITQLEPGELLTCPPRSAQN